MQANIMYVQPDDTVKYNYRFIVNSASVYICIKLDDDVSGQNR
jgi:hypothetical protein